MKNSLHFLKPALLVVISFIVSAIPVDAAADTQSTAGGTYVWTATTSVLTMNWTSSSFQCDGPNLGAETHTGVQITATAMTWPDSGDTFTRPSGISGDIGGNWNAADSGTGNSFTVAFNSDGSMSLTGNIVSSVQSCGGGGGGQNIQIEMRTDRSSNYNAGPRQHVNIDVSEPIGTFSSVGVSGPGITDSLQLTSGPTRVEAGVLFDTFFGGFDPTTTIQSGATYTFTVTKTAAAGGGSSTFNQTYTGTPVTDTTTGAITITSPTEYALANATLGSPLDVRWVLPTAYTISQVRQAGYVQTSTTPAQGYSCQVDGPTLAANATSGSITLPTVCGPNNDPALQAGISVLAIGANGERSINIYLFSGTSGGADTQAPTVPTGLAATPTSDTQVNLTWTASTDNIGVTAYKVYRNAVLIGSPSGPSYSDTALSPLTSYSYTVAACDAAGNCSAKPLAVSAKTLTLVCTSPQVLQGGVCITPVATPNQIVSNPATNVSVDSTGALVVTASTVPIVLSPTAPENALVKLQATTPVSFTSGTTTLQYTDTSGSAQLVIRTVDNQPQLEVAKGTVEISAPASNITISVVSSNQKTVGSIVTQTAADTVVVEKTDTTSAVFVDAGKVDYKGPGQSITVYQGENTQLATSGTLNQLSLGSLGGKKQVPGDPLPLTATPKDSATKVPNLDGNLPRFNNTVTLKDIVKDMIKDLVKDTTGVGQLSYDKTTGVITYVVGTTTYRLIALGDVLVQLNQFSATTAVATAGGAYALAARGIQMSLSGALGYFSDLQKLVTAADAKGTISLKPTGAIDLRAGGGHFVVMPGSSATLPKTPTLLPGFEADASGYVVFRDSQGTLQTLYPAFLDVDTLTATFNAEVPTIVLTNKADGTVTAALGTQNYTLRPEYVVVDQPVGHVADAYWSENGMILLRNADKSAQGFKVQ